jgi:hypothetical protein
MMVAGSFRCIVAEKYGGARCRTNCIRLLHGGRHCSDEAADQESVVLEALRDLESGKVYAARAFDWDPEFQHGYAARNVASAARSKMTWKEASEILERLAAVGKITRVVIKSPQYDQETVALSERYGVPLDHVVAVYRSFGA